MKNLMDFCIGTPLYWLVGFGIMFGAGTAAFGRIDPFILKVYSHILACTCKYSHAHKKCVFRSKTYSGKQYAKGCACRVICEQHRYSTRKCCFKSFYIHWNSSVKSKITLTILAQRMFYINRELKKNYISDAKIISSSPIFRMLFHGSCI